MNSIYVIRADRFISGVFEREQDAHTYLQEIPDGERSKHALTEVPEMQYPVYLIEDSTGFRFVTADDAVEDIKQRAPCADEFDSNVTLYRFDRDYRPKVAGSDEMGTINHDHVHNDRLAAVKAEGRSGLWIMR